MTDGNLVSGRALISKLDVAARQLEGGSVSAETVEQSENPKAESETEEKQSSGSGNGYRNRPTPKQWGAMVSILEKLGEDTEAAKEQASLMSFDEATAFIGEHIDLLQRVES